MRLKRLAILFLFLLSIYSAFTVRAVGQPENSSPFSRICSQQNQPYQGFLKPPSDTLFCLQWNFGVAHGINLWEAWTATKLRGERVKVAIIDGGFHYEDGSDFNPHLFLPGFDYVNSKITQDPEKDYKNSYGSNTDHGTNVWGVIGQTTDNSKGTAGVSDEVEVIPYRLDLKRGDLASQIINAILRAEKAGADIINLSLDSSEKYNSEIQKAAEFAYNHNVLLVASAGNSLDGQLRYPVIRNAFDEQLEASSDGFSYQYRNGDFTKDENGEFIPKWDGDFIRDENGNYIKFRDGFYDSNGNPIQSLPVKRVRALIVAARNEQGDYPEYSNPKLFHGQDPKYNYDGRINIAAPGGAFDGEPCQPVDEDSVDEINNYSGGIAQVDFQKGRGTVVLFCKGTSQAAPHVSGVAALVISVLKDAGYPTSYGRVDPDLVISIIEQSAHVSEHKSGYKDMPFKLGEHWVGHEHPLDAGLAVKLAQAVARPTAPTPASLTPEEAENKVSNVIAKNLKTLTTPLETRSPFPSEVGILSIPNINGLNLPDSSATNVSTPDNSSVSTSTPSPSPSTSPAQTLSDPSDNSSQVLLIVLLVFILLLILLLIFLWRRKRSKPSKKM